MRRRKGSRKVREARKALLEQPWWKIQDNWFFIGTFAVTVLIVGLAVAS